MSTGLTNWSGNLSYGAGTVLRPRTVAELQEIVARDSRVRALGTRHSFSAVADTPGTLVSLSEFGSDIVIDAGRMTASVAGGTSYGVFAAALQAQGFALHNMGSLPHISVAGATATGTHGSGDGNGILATAINAVELVTAEGALVTVDRSSPDLAALAVGLGAFGVIVRLTVDIQPTYDVRQDIYLNAPWDLVLDQLDKVMASAYSVSLMGSYSGSTIQQLWQKVRLGDGEPPVVADSLYGGSWYDDGHVPPGANLNVRGSVPGPWSDRLPHFRLDAVPSAGGDELQSEWFVARRHAAPALRVLRSLAERIAPHLHATEIRSCAGDELWLSPAYHRDSLCIGFTWRNHPAEVQALIGVIEAALAPFEPRPHWGKLAGFRTDQLAARFPRLADFRALARTYDPAGKFWNPFLDSVFASVS